MEHRRKTYKKPSLEKLGTLSELESKGHTERVKTARALAGDGAEEAGLRRGRG